MDRVKFRAWNTKKKFMLDIFDSEHEDWYLPKWKEEWMPMQCTGLEDKNGKLIYEGDIVKPESGVYFSGEYVGEIKYDGGAFMWFSVPSLLERRFNPSCGTQDGLDSGECEIIGNIYETPELLME